MSPKEALNAAVEDIAVQLEQLRGRYGVKHICLLVVDDGDGSAVEIVANVKPESIPLALDQVGRLLRHRLSS